MSMGKKRSRAAKLSCYQVANQPHPDVHVNRSTAEDDEKKGPSDKQPFLWTRLIEVLAGGISCKANNLPADTEGDERRCQLHGHDTNGLLLARLSQERSQLVGAPGPSAFQAFKAPHPESQRFTPQEQLRSRRS